MQSPPLEWAALIGSLAAIDYLRSRGDADQDTLSEVVRGVVRRHPRGDLIFGIGLFAAAEAFRRHIVRHP